MRRLLQISLLCLTLTPGMASAKLPETESIKTADLDTQIAALENKYEVYSGNRESTEALQDLRRQLAKMQAMGFPSSIARLNETNDDAFKKAVDTKMKVAGLLNPRDCSYIAITLLALSQGYCPRKPEIIRADKPAIITVDTPTDR